MTETGWQATGRFDAGAASATRLAESCLAASGVPVDRFADPQGRRALGTWATDLASSSSARLESAKATDGVYVVLLDRLTEEAGSVPRPEGDEPKEIWLGVPAGGEAPDRSPLATLTLQRSPAADLVFDLHAASPAEGRTQTGPTARSMVRPMDRRAPEPSDALKRREEWFKKRSGQS